LDLAVEQILAFHRESRPSHHASVSTIRGFTEFYFPFQSECPFNGLSQHFLSGPEPSKDCRDPIFEDVKWMALSLFLANVSSDAVVAGILLHAADPFRTSTSEWLTSTARAFPPGVLDVLRHVGGRAPNPLTEPEGISQLLCQRPLQLIPGPQNRMHEARVIAAASLLSPALHETERPLNVRDRYDLTTMHIRSLGSYRYVWHLLEQIHTLRQPEIESFFGSVVKERLHAYGSRTGPEMWWPANQYQSRRDDIRETLECLRRRSAEQTREPTPTKIYSWLHHAHALAIQVSSAWGTHRDIALGLSHPFFGDVSKGVVASTIPTSFDRKASICPDEKQTIIDTTMKEGEGIVARLASDIARQTHEADRKERMTLATRATGDFSDTGSYQRHEDTLRRLAIAGNVETSSQSSHFDREKLFHAVMLRVQERVLANPEGLRQAIRHAINQSKGIPEEPEYRAVLERLERAEENNLAEIIGGLNSTFTRWVRKAVFTIEMVAKRSGIPVITSNEQILAQLCDFAIREFSQEMGREGRKGLDNALSALLRDSHASVAIRASDISPLPSQDVRRISLAARMMRRFIGELKATGTPRNQVESYEHVLEVGTILALSGAPADFILGGLLHDLYELAAASDRAGTSHRARLPLIRRRIRNIFGSEIDDLVELVSEVRPATSDSNLTFLERKMGIFHKVKERYQTDPQLARKAITVLLAAKVSTLSELLLDVQSTGESKPRSKGDYLENLRVMWMTRDLAGQMCAENIVTALFDDLMSRWCSAAPRPESLFYMAQEYFYGEGRFPRDFEKAAAYFSMAAEAGHNEAFRWLAYCFKEGLGVPKNQLEAEKYLSLWAPELTN
jgi:hypothetical protein